MGRGGIVPHILSLGTGWQSDFVSPKENMYGILLTGGWVDHELNWKRKRRDCRRVFNPFTYWLSYPYSLWAHDYSKCQETLHLYHIGPTQPALYRSSNALHQISFSWVFSGRLLNNITEEVTTYFSAISIASSFKITHYVFRSCYRNFPTQVTRYDEV
jgi:hypothetical protein